MRLWIDTDVGGDPDDAITLLCAMAHPEVELVGVSTVDKDTAWRAEVARRLVDAPVVDGAGLAAEMVSDTDPEALLAIGPLTNVANLLAAGYRPPRLAVMGGTLRPIEHRGEVMAIEHNFGTDGNAAARVMRGYPGTLLCTLDVTVRLVLDPHERDAFAAADARLVAHFRNWDEWSGGAALCMHDPLALLALLGEPARTETRSLVAEPDGRLVESANGVEHEVVVDVDAPAAKARILALLSNASGHVPYP
jgi:inosine-uridine nucleoside N-ribohydrolase